ncbi:hypothetical protein M8818_005914 [Zalaria obscura]|uniref:Uncharacterized protein n=1 Tax=Zalaria obscura TaxID=2024903 RepID=A0ACC3S722_9PEZI
MNRCSRPYQERALCGGGVEAVRQRPPPVVRLALNVWYLASANGPRRPDIGNPTQERGEGRGLLRKLHGRWEHLGAPSPPRALGTGGHWDRRCPCQCIEDGRLYKGVSPRPSCSSTTISLLPLADHTWYATPQIDGPVAGADQRGCISRPPARGR